ncbi:MAG: radical SAM protein [Armatimonadota bacterium]|nr:radical SAM protein [Armatimonadota bacterium]
MAAPREILARTVLSKSGVGDYSVNCYVGCMHGCIYCYARFMRKFTNHTEPWGKFLDVKINAPVVLANEVRRKKRGYVFLSSVCDGWQPIEMRYKLTRQCVKILVEAGFHASLLTKSKLVRRDFDILQGFSNCDVGCTLTTADESLRFKIEPGASPTWERICVLEEACERGIKAWAFLGPFLPELTDTDESLDRLIGAIASLPLEHICADKLNMRPGVWGSIVRFLSRYDPTLIPRYEKLFFDEEALEQYRQALANRLRAVASSHGIEYKLRVIFG